MTDPNSGYGNPAGSPGGTGLDPRAAYGQDVPNAWKTSPATTQTSRPNCGTSQATFPEIGEQRGLGVLTATHLAVKALQEIRKTASNLDVPRLVSAAARYEQAVDYRRS